MGSPLGNRIQALRLEKGVTLPKLAEVADISKGLLYQIETSDTTNPSFDTLSKIARALGVTLATLLEKESAKARRVVPEEVEPALKEFIEERHKEGTGVDGDIVQALYVLQNRSGSAKRTKETWAWLYRSIEMSMRGPSRG